MKQRLMRLWKQCLRCGASVIAAIVLVAMFYLAVVLGQPEKAGETTTADQPLTAASPAVQLTSADQLPQLIATFPAPAMSMIAGGELNAGMSYDTAYEDGFARVLELRYLLPSGGTVKVTSIYPARALSLITREGFTLQTATGVSLAGLTAVRMDGPSEVRLHAQSDQGLYVVTYPRAEEEAALAAMKSLQLTK